MKRDERRGINKIRNKKKNKTTVVGVSFDGAPLQHLHIFKSFNEYRAWGQTKTSQWEGHVPCCGLRSSRRYPSSTLGETQSSGVGTERPPELSRGERGALVARGELAFYLCPFSSVISALPLQPQMANMAEGLAFVSKMIMMEVFFHPDTDISSHSVTDILMS